jgi:hypothetical protein
VADEVTELGDAEAVAAEPAAVGERPEPKPLGLGFRPERAPVASAFARRRGRRASRSYRTHCARDVRIAESIVLELALAALLMIAS